MCQICFLIGLCFPRALAQTVPSTYELTAMIERMSHLVTSAMLDTDLALRSGARGLESHRVVRHRGGATRRRGALRRDGLLGRPPQERDRAPDDARCGPRVLYLILRSTFTHVVVGLVLGVPLASAPAHGQTQRRLSRSNTGANRASTAPVRHSALVRFSALLGRASDPAHYPRAPCARSSASASA